MTEETRKFEQLAVQLKELSEALAQGEPSSLSLARTKQLRREIDDIYKKLGKVMEDLDPIKHPGFVFDPSNPTIAGRIVGIAMIAQTRRPLANVDRFYGSGVYAIYYNGDFAAYNALSRQEHPIYVGKADPSDPASKTAMEQGDKLSGRLNEHRKNIAKATTTLKVEDFEYRALVVQSGWQTSAESYLIDLFKPIWNSEVGICYGFGKHGDAPETRANTRSPWDTMHPGRDWAHRDPEMKDARPAARIVEDIAQHLSKNPSIGSLDEILRRFLAEMRAFS